MLDVGINDEQIEIESLSVSKYKFLTEELDVTAALSRDEIKNRLLEFLISLNNGSTFLKVNLTGELSPHVDLDLELLNEMLNEYCEFGMVADQAQSGIDFENLSEERQSGVNLFVLFWKKLINLKRAKKKNCGQLYAWELWHLKGMNL